VRHTRSTPVGSLCFIKRATSRVTSITGCGWESKNRLERDFMRRNYSS
jgi:hypothetical protein